MLCNRVNLCKELVSVVSFFNTDTKDEVCIVDMTGLERAGKYKQICFRHN